MPARTLAPILIFGPTASGKSAVALALAERLGGAVVNADSQQVYRDWRVLTARPTAADEARAPHRLYGHVPLDADHSVGRWLAEVEAVLAECAESGLPPILAGGTGLYFRALTRGLAPVPPVPAEARAEAEATLARLGRQRFADALAARDPATAATLDAANPARLVRAWEVLEATGRPLAHWQSETPPPIVDPGRAVRLVLDPPRAWLAERIGRRLEGMVAEGALDEVAAATARGLPWSAPGMKALGARDLARHLAGDCTLDEALAAAAAATRRYAKRQATWARGQMPDWPRVTTTDRAEAVRAILADARAPASETGRGRG
ncbi:MAG TPA: tRNA (adenosine(37)-N6)-dimethylallyltransferase MiaA [Thermohalobaculum sp.]|nr:tRNA (adenosine(37)-N6)-dimethylallyltransferase MiaA [Thermohalobaculum sp.]